MEFADILDAAFDDAQFDTKQLPDIDLYMDQVLTLVNKGLDKNKRSENDVLLTKAMVNNYSKEHLITPIRGKKYSREQLMQLLCIMNLKPNLTLLDIHALVSRDSVGDISFEKAYSHAQKMKSELRGQLRSFAKQSNDSLEPENMKPEERLLTLSLLFSSMSSYMRRVCEQMLDSAEKTAGK